MRQLAGSPDNLLKNNALLAAIRLWAERARVTNMHMERLIGLMQGASPARCDISRALSAGFLSQVLQVHYSAGGISPSCIKRSDLVASGVPLRARGLSAAAKQQRAARVRGAVVAHNRALDEGEDLAQIKGHYKYWANAMQRCAKRRRGRCSRVEYRERCDQFWNQWVSGEELSDVEASDVEDDAAKYEQDIGERLWGISSSSWPVLPGRLAEQAELEAPRTQPTRSGGYTVRLHAVRQKFLEGLFHGPKDSSVPIRLKLCAEVVCKHVDPGPCRRKHPAAMMQAHQDLARSLEKHPAGTLFELFATYGVGPDGAELVNNSSYSRMFAKAVQRKDELTLAEVERNDRGAPSFVPGGVEGFAFRSGEMVLSDFWEHPPVSLELRFFERAAGVRLTALDTEEPLPQKIELVKALELSVVAHHQPQQVPGAHHQPQQLPGAHHQPQQVPGAHHQPQQEDELTDEDGEEELLEHEEKAFEMETSLVGGLKKLKSRRAKAKLPKRVRSMQPRLPRPQVASTSQATAAHQESSAGAVSYIVAHRLAEKFPTMQVLDDGSYIRISTNSDGSCDMRAVCAQHSIGQGHLECNLSRTCRVGRGGNLGRPLGLLCWFLRQGQDPEIKDKVFLFLRFGKNT